MSTTGLAPDTVTFLAGIDADAPPAREPDSVALTRIGMVSTWQFDTSDPLRVSPA